MKHFDAKMNHFELKLATSRKIAKTNSQPKGGPLPKNGPRRLKMI